MTLSSYDHASDEPKAVANKAFGLLLRGEWQELLAFGGAKFGADPGNDGLAGYLIQAIEHGVGVRSSRVLEFKRIDEDFFVEE